MAQNVSSASDTTTHTDTLKYPINEGQSYPFSNSGSQSPLLLKTPSDVKQTIVYNPETGRYEFSEKIGEMNYREPSSMSMEEYRKYEAHKSEMDYWQEKAAQESGSGPSFMKNLRLSTPVLGKVFDTDVINIKPQGNADLIFGYSISKNGDPRVPIRNRKTGSFLFKQKIMMNVNGNIGDKVQVGLNFNTEATFEFENKTKLEYSGKEDEILKKVQAGNVTFNLPGTLIRGSQSLYGLKTDMQFGKLTVSSVISHQRGQSSTINVQGGAQLNDFEISAGDYDVNRHFFLAHFFRDHYDKWLANLPHIESQVKIQQIEVWVVNKQGDFNNARNIVAFMDLAEGVGPTGEENYMSYNQNLLSPFSRDPAADNNLNSLYSKLAGNAQIRGKNIQAAIRSISPQLQDGRDYVYQESARMLSDREYTVNRDLGYISLTSPLRNDEILAVAYTYTYKGKTYKVGELSTDVSSPGTLILKLLKGTTPSPKYKNWDLMMKNVYSIGAYQVSPKGFVLNILYKNDNTGVPVNYISEPDKTAISKNVNNQILLKVLDLDNLDSHNEPHPDGVFDYIEGVTIDSKNGRIYFPLLEPFGSDLRKKITDNSNDIAKNRTADKYVYQELYDSTQTVALQIAEKNKFILKGQYSSSSSSDIQLNAMNIPKGSVKVTAGGIPLVEGQDYTVDYTLGRVKILNQGLLESGTPLQISLESNSLFNIQTKTLVGTHLDYKFSDNFNLGGTIMHLKETPLTKKVNMGEEPISNTIWGLNTSYRTKSQLLTTLIDKLPFLETKQPSSIAVDGEFAQLIPGQAKVIGKNGVAYIDDFEASQTKIELKNYSSWNLCSPPKDAKFFMNGDKTGLAESYGRAKLAWYFIDPIFYTSSSRRPNNDSVNIDLSKNAARRINENEMYPNKKNALPGQDYISILNLAYYPDERGPYNYDPNLTHDRKLPDPEERWGGITRAIVNTDFETSNIEYIEFWLMDPYDDLDQRNNPGGDMYIQLGDISEDVLPDGRKSFESGLPENPNDTSQLDTTPYGRVPKGRSFVNSFTTNDAARKYQDVGLDGLSDSQEKKFFAKFLQKLKANNVDTNGIDVSADDYQYFLSSKLSNAGIIERYKNYNGMEGNSPVISGNSSVSSAATNTPDIEDINQDNTMSTSEAYFQYHVSLRPEDLGTVGKNFIVDEHSKVINNLPYHWYLFRIPINEFQKNFRGADFKSIRFMRLLLTGFKKPVVLRFATLDLVRAEWRIYDGDVGQTAPSVNRPGNGTTFETSAVNIEENNSKTPVNYVLPPGIDRATDPSQPTLQQLNEQALLVKVENLQDGDARAVYKNVQLDLRQYKKLKMFVHAEALPGDNTLHDYDVSAFLRMGSDYQNNYYEYEVPLKVTPPGIYNNDDQSQRLIVWPDENSMNIVLNDLVNLKEERNKAVQNNPLNYSIQSVYTKVIPVVVDTNGEKFTIYVTLKVKGNPNLSDIRQIMLGIRNPGNESPYPNDGQEKSVEVWFNELRLTDFNNKGGWAANGRVQMQLADFGVLNVAGSTSSPGFGSVEQKIEERSHEQTNQYDISSNLELGKFFPEKANVSIPLYFGISRTIINPEYYPRDPDIKFSDILKQASSKHERDSLKEISQDYTARNSINLTNVRWNKQFKKLKIISPGDFSASVNYSETKAHNYNVEYNNLRKYGASFNYVYNSRPKSIQPFRKSKAFRSPAFRIIRDINFSPLPSRFTFGTVMDRNYQEIKMRDVYSDVNLKIDSTVDKDFTWDRNYNLRWDLTRGLKLNYSATNTARIDEPPGGYDLFSPNNQHWKDSVWANIKKGGRNMTFNQNFDANYLVPINKLPLLNWINLNTGYSSTFDWERGEELRDKSRKLGNNLKNSNTIKANSNFNFAGIYEKIPYLRNLNSRTRRNPSAKGSNEKENYKTVKFEKRTFFKKDLPKIIFHNLKTEKVDVKAYDVQGKEIPVKFEVLDENKVKVTASKDIIGAQVVITGKIPKKQNPLIFIANNTMRILTGLKSANASWSRTSGTLLPGYLPDTKYFGISTSQDFYGAPGWPFAFGWQDQNIPWRAIDKGWLTVDTTFNKPIVFTQNDILNLRASYEPFNGFRIDLSAMRAYAQNQEQLYYYGYQDKQDSSHYYKGYFVDNPYTGGNFSISVITLSSAFEKVNKKNDWASAAFNKMKEYRKIISARRFNEKFHKQPYQLSNGYFDGYGPTSQDVLVPAFLAAYTGIDPHNVTLQPFFWNMMPNWRITFDGLSKIDWIKKIFKNITLSHSYKSTYSIGGFGTNVAYFPDNTSTGYDLQGFMRDQQDNIISKYQFDGVSINEQLSPLIGIDMTWNNSLLTKLEISKTRMIALSLSNNQINESRNKDLTIGAGYRIKDVPLKITAGGNTKQIKSDVNLRFDLTLRDNISIIRFLSQEEANQMPEVTTGMKKLSYSLTADYVVSQKFSVQLFFDHTVNTPYTSRSYLTAETNMGFSLRLSL